MDKLNECQSKAMGALESGRNVFLTGAAGTGKSHLTRHFLKGKSRFVFPVVASTGAAALIIGGRTFHSFFGLGTMAGGADRVVGEALTKDRVVSRLKSARGVLIDEVSMLDAATFDAAEQIARRARGKPEPWGGLQVVVVGDFRQLPPVSKGSAVKDWCFNSSAWKKSDFFPVMLKTPMRATHLEFLEVLNHLRAGVVTPQAEALLNERMVPAPADITRLFGKRGNVEDYNLKKLAEVSGEERLYHTVYWGETDNYEEQIRKNAPIPSVLRLKEGAFVMIRRNDTSAEPRWVNGSLGWVRAMNNFAITVELVDGGTAEIEEVSFTLKNADGDEVASASNFPINLAWATTIHKSQGCTLDRMLVDLTELWEPGHAYVALSRVRSPEGLYVAGWDRSSIKSDQAVTDFHKRLFA